MDGNGERTLVMTDGGLPSLVCCLLGTDASNVVAWLPPAGSDLGGGRIGLANRKAVEDQADLLGLLELIVANPSSTPHSADQPVGARTGTRAGGPPASALLLAAAEEAIQRRCSRVVWPVVCGSDLERLYKAGERASLVTRLALLDCELGGGSPEVRVELPLADLTPAQVADLALDLDAPLPTCWWYRPEAQGLPSATEQRLEWESTLRGASRLRGYSGVPGLVGASQG